MEGVIATDNFSGQNLSWRCYQSANLQKIRSASRRAMCLVVYPRQPLETSQPSIYKVCIPKQPAQASKLGTITLGTPCLMSRNLKINLVSVYLPKSKIMKALTKVTY